MKKTTLCYLLKADSILLAEKKRGFGAGRWNGAGGKVKEGESIEDATIREVREEVGVRVGKRHLKKCAILVFSFPEEPSWDQECHVFSVSEWRGEPKETEEMSPSWFSLADIPYANMWKDDPYWLPQVLRGECLNAQFIFSRKGEVLSSHIESLVHFS